jgi:pyruvate formate lyase activating enzyme
MQKRLPIDDITPFTMLDFKGYLSAIVWFCGCNMRCGYCYNPEIVYSKGKLSANDALEFLDSRKKLLKGVVLSGGEPTLYRRINHFAKQLKQMGYKVKLDTNGTKPQTLKRMLDAKNVDFVSLDFKAPLYKFQTITKMKQNGFFDVAKSLQYLKNSQIEFEVRTTVHGDLLDAEDICEMIHLLKNAKYHKAYYLQNFLEAKTISGIKAQKKGYDMTKIVKAANESAIEINFRNF